MTLSIGIDVGGTKILGGVVDEGGAIVEELRVESPATDAEQIEKAIETLVTELVFSYPGLGTLLFSAIGQNDYPVISSILLIVTVAVLIANFAVDVATGFIDPRIRAAESGER